MSTLSALEATIVEIVGYKQGCKYTELVTEMHEQTTAGPIFKAVERLVERGDLIEIEYSLPNMRWRMKSFLLPGKTGVTIAGLSA